MGNGNKLPPIAKRNRREKDKSISHENNNPNQKNFPKFNFALKPKKRRNSLSQIKNNPYSGIYISKMVGKQVYSLIEEYFDKQNTYFIIDTKKRYIKEYYLRWSSSPVDINFDDWEPEKQVINFIPNVKRIYVNKDSLLHLL